MMLNYLEFEQPIAELEAKIDELRNVSRNGDYDLGLEEEAAAVEASVEGVLAEGYRTPDIAADGGEVVSTARMGNTVAGRV